MTFTMGDATHDHRKTAAQILDWYHESGVDIALDEAPHDRFAEGRLAQQKLQSQRSPAATPDVSQHVPAATGSRHTVSAPETKRPHAPLQPATLHIVPPDVAIAEAKRLAAEARSLMELRTAMLGFEGCSLKASASQLVFGEGNPRTRFMLIGEPPAREEDIAGLPFVGPAGRLLDRMIAAMSLKRGDLYLANVIPWRPPGNRMPTAAEIAMCQPFIERQIELIAPDVLLCLGNLSAQMLLDARTGIARFRGTWCNYRCGDRLIKGIASFHPGFLLSQPSQKRLAWQDLMLVMEQLGSEAVVRG